MNSKIFTYFLFLQLLLLVCNSKPEVSAIIVFGDSTADSGNNNYIPTVAKSNFQPYGRDFEGGKPTGRFCNGRLFTDFISEALEIKWSIPAYLDSDYGIEDFASGVSFASSASGYDNATSDVLSVIPLWQQLEYFKEYKEKLTISKGSRLASRILNQALYIMSLGINDFIENYFVSPRRSSQYTVEEYQNFLIVIAKKFILDIYRLGARKVAITGYLPIGCLPVERTQNLVFGHACKEDYNKVARDFNLKLQDLIDKLNEEVKDIKLVMLNLYDPVQEAIEKPYIYGEFLFLSLSLLSHSHSMPLGGLRF
ncbi:hypothetical protein GIB67_007951 [Kingdonia uniflora]|uniref:GDSL esterase/lipase n=1 Tax=Kingdonia uniflora TaxID=39325 RepID=A0A7J7LTR9_9MAGN|nr:hypothetical protein GIB67_007951 [Kingdonia uniflora]